MRAQAALPVALPLLLVSVAHAGAYHLSSLPSLNQPGRINHTYGYSGAAQHLTISVCADAAAADFVPFIQLAIEWWNQKTTDVPNCVGFCPVFIDPLPRSTGPVDAHNVLMHELGHCLFGLDHTNNYSPDGTGSGGSDFTASYLEISIDDGDDNVRGTWDDIPTPLPGTRVVHWFRTGLNDPYLAVPGTVDNTNYTRVVQNLPPFPHRWPTNANRLSSFQLGFESSQSVMFGLGGRRSRYVGLLPDDVNTIAYAQAGLDEVIGGDDYTYTVQFVESCSGADVRIEMSDVLGDALGDCSPSYIELPISGEPLRHYALTSSGGPARLRLNNLIAWGFQFILWDDFEIGDTSFWTTTVPPVAPRARGSVPAAPELE